jgi:hypothetical protein
VIGGKMLPRKTALITDLDNTLFDWVELWVNCFSTMLDGIAELSAIPKEKLIPEIAAVHQKHGTSEYSFLIEEIPSLKPVLKGRPATEVFAVPIERYRLQRRKHLSISIRPSRRPSLRSKVEARYSSATQNRCLFELSRPPPGSGWCPRLRILPGGPSPAKRIIERGSRQLCT